MSDQADLFRREALEFRARGADAPSGVVRLGGRWLRWLFWSLVLAVVAGIIAASLIRTQETTTGPAVLNGRRDTFSAQLPAAVANELRSARAVYVDVRGSQMPVKVLHARPVDQNVAPRSGLPSPKEPAILLSGRLLGVRAGLPRMPEASELAGRIVVILRSTSVGGVIARQFEAMLGYGGGQP